MTEEETEALLDALGIGWDNPTDALVFDYTDPLAVGGLHVVMVRQKNIILTTHGLDEKGPFVMVRRFKGLDDPQEYKVVIETLDNVVEVR